MKAILQKLFFFVAFACAIFCIPQFSPVFASTPDAGHTIVSISMGTVLANGSSTFTVTIQLEDSSGNTLTSNSISLSASDGSVNVSPSNFITANSGNNYVFTLNSNNPATSQLTIHDQANGDITNSSWTLTFAPTPTQSPTPTPIGTCNDATPAAPQITSTDSGGVHSIILSWNAVAAPVSYYLVSYGTTSGNYIYGNPNVGNVTSYTVGSLSTGKTYYFVVKAVNGCMPGAYSNEMSGVAGVSSPTPTISTDTSGTDMSSTDQTSQTDLTNQTTSDTPAPTAGPPITPVPKSTSASAVRTIIYTVIGLLLVVSAIVLILVNKSGKKSGKSNSPITPRQPPPPQEMGTSDIFNQPNGIDPQDEPPGQNDQTPS